MSRKKQAIKRKKIPDLKYHSDRVANFINKLMFEGKKSVASQIVYNSFSIIQEKLKEDPLKVFNKAIDNTRPLLEVKSRRVGGATYQVPIEVTPSRSETLAMRWIINFSRARQGRTMHEKLAGELIDAFKNQGTSVKKREDTHKMAEANRAFAHYRW